MSVRTLLASLVLVSLGTALAADKPEPTKQELIQQYIVKFGPPGPEHKNFEPLVGNWDAKVKMWMDPSQPASESEGSLVRKPVLDGRFIQEEFDGKFAGFPYKGFGTVGFDRAKNAYVMTWIDSMGTALHLSKGTYDAATKTFTFSQNDVCPITGKPTRMRDTLRIVSPDEQVMTMYSAMGDEKEAKSMEITFTRKK
jgi:hypothetical protein